MRPVRFRCRPIAWCLKLIKLYVAALLKSRERLMSRRMGLGNPERGPPLVAQPLVFRLQALQDVTAAPYRRKLASSRFAVAGRGLYSPGENLGGTTVYNLHTATQERSEDVSRRGDRANPRGQKGEESYL